MRARDLHPLWCLAGEWQPGGAGLAAPREEEEDEAPAPPTAVAGLLYKWTNIGRGWRPRWFAIRGGVLAYSKIRPPRGRGADPGGPRPRRQADRDGTRRRCRGAAHRIRACQGDAVAHISSFSESKSDDKRFYIITPTKTLQLRTGCAKDRAAWIEALVTARSEYSFNGDLSADQNDATFSTNKLRNRLRAEGVGEAIIKDCEQIVHSEFSQYHTEMKQRCEEYLSFIGSLPREVEVIDSVDTSISEKPQSCSSMTAPALENVVNTPIHNLLMMLVNKRLLNILMEMSFISMIQGKVSVTVLLALT